MRPHRVADMAACWDATESPSSNSGEGVATWSRIVGKFQCRRSLARRAVSAVIHVPSQSLNCSACVGGRGIRDVHTRVKQLRDGCFVEAAGKVERVRAGMLA